MVFSDLHYDEMSDGNERLNIIKEHIEADEILIYETWFF